MKLSTIRTYVHARRDFDRTRRAIGYRQAMKSDAYRALRRAGEQLQAACEREYPYTPNSGRYSAMVVFDHISTMAGMLTIVGPHYGRIREGRKEAAS